jgi:hypothetical protein
MIEAIEGVLSRLRLSAPRQPDSSKAQERGVSISMERQKGVGDANVFRFLSRGVRELGRIGLRYLYLLHPIVLERLRLKFRGVSQCLPTSTE